MSTESNRAPRGRTAAGLLVALALGACGEQAPRPRLVVLYSTCTLNKDFLAPYGPPDGRARSITPNLQAFADESLVFERHNTEAGQSGVAFASIYTGLHADRHGVYQHPRPLPDSLVTATEAFAAAGYEPHFWSGQPMASAKHGYGQGVAPENVHHTHIPFTKHAKPLPEGFLAGTTANTPAFDAVLAELAADPARRAFVQVNFTITHELYHEYADLETILAFERAFPSEASGLSPQEVRETLDFFEEHRHSLQLNFPETRARLGMTDADVARLDRVLQLAYGACVHQLDQWFGRFVDRIRAAGLLDESVIAFTADHGETFYHESEPLHWMHGLQLAPTVLEVPWILRAPGFGVRPGRFAGVTRSVDVLPTLLGLVGERLPESLELEGIDLVPHLEGPDPGLLAFSHTSTLGEARVERYRKEGHAQVLELLPAADPRRMWVRVREGDRVWEIRHSAGGAERIVSFDLADDRARTRDLFDPADPHHREMVGRLEAYRARLVANYSDTPPSEQREFLRELQNLGYVEGAEE